MSVEDPFKSGSEKAVTKIYTESSKNIYTLMTNCADMV